jgi:hypothetical protein
VPYNGTEGLPIREETLLQFGPDVVTRNSYGAWCLNTPDVMILDVDEDDFYRLPALGLKRSIGVVVACLLVATVMTGGPWTGQAGAGPWATSALGALGAFVVARATIGLGRKLWLQRLGGPVAWLGRQLQGTRQRWALYRTPAGARAIRLDTVMDPTSHDSDALQAHLAGDPTYRQMCRRQACYRARVTPKPWRIGLERLRGAGWPTPNHRLADWVTQYDRVRAAWGACAWIQDVGQGDAQVRPSALRELHDRLALAPPGCPPQKIA